MANKNGNKNMAKMAFFDSADFYQVEMAVKIFFVCNLEFNIFNQRKKNSNF